MRLPLQQLRQQPATDSSALPLRPHVQLDDLEVGRIEPYRALVAGQGGRHMLRPPLAVGACVPVPEADDPLALARDEKDEVVALRVYRQAVARPLLGERAGPERGAMDVTQLRRKRQRIDLLDREPQFRERSTTTCVIGSGTSSRAWVTTPRSNQRDLSGG